MGDGRYLIPDAPTVDSKVQGGFSPQGDLAAMTNYRRKLSRGAWAFTWVLALIAVIGFPLYGAISGELDFTESLLYGAGLGTMFLVIGIVSLLRSRRDHRWEGIVHDKHVRERVDTRGGESARQTHHVYVLSVKDDSGKQRQLKFEDQPAVYDYFQVGDRVRHHAGFPFPEKYNKSGDETLLCVSCGGQNAMQDETCRRCRCPLMVP